jgi:hypothetical protein
MRIVANQPEYKPTWLHSDILDRLWKASGTSYVANWKGAPIFPDWFEYEDGHPVAFKTADMNVDVTAGVAKLYFIDGRHRTRWLMTRFALVPVGLEDSSYAQALSLGLATRRVDPSEFLSTFDY